MYNEKQKTEYIKLRQSKMGSTDITKVLNNYFSKVEPMEEELGKDLCEFNKNELLKYYKSLHSKSLETLMGIHSQFRIYTAITTGNDDEFTSITYKQLKNCVAWNNEFVTRDELLKALNSLDNVGDKFIVLALFEGICGNMMQYLSVFSAENLHKKKSCFIFNINGETKEFEVSKKLYMFAEEAINEYNYYSDSRSLMYNIKDKRALKSMNNSSGSNNESVRYHNLTNRLLKIQKQLGLKVISRKGLTESGRLNLITNLMIEQNISDPREAILNKENKKKIEERYGEFTSIKRFLLKYNAVILSMVKNELKT